MIKKRPLWIFSLIFFPPLFTSFLFFSSCHYYKLEKNLKPDDSEFLSKVRYIITQRERKVFLELPDSEKKAFREEFWGKRDLYPETEENEFKKIYFERVEKADELFIGEGRPGWATDRGRVYILYGPPETRRTDSRVSLNNLCREIWYYGNFPVVFIDEFCVGQYTLATFDLSPIYHMNLKYMSDFASTQTKDQLSTQKGEIIFDFTWEIKKIISEPREIKGIIEINIPYANLWFKEEKNILLTRIEVHLEIIGVNDKSLWDYERSFMVKTDEESLLKEKNKDYLIEIPFLFDDENTIRLLKKQGARVVATLKNETSGKTVEKVLKIKL